MPLGLGELFKEGIGPRLRAVDYRRVSSDDQADGYSLAAQAERNAAYIAGKGWEHVRSYEDPGRSGKSVLRPAFQEMLAAAKRGEFDVIVVHKLDRFSRNLTDVLLTLRDLKQVNVRFASVSEDIDFTTKFGELILIVLAWLAEWYLENLRTEVRKGKQERARQGHWNGTLPFGYTTPARLKAKLKELGERYLALEMEHEAYVEISRHIEGTLEQYRHMPDTAAVPCPFDAPAVQRAFQEYATGRYSDRDIAEMLNRFGHRTNGVHGRNPFTREAVADMLRNRFYIGEVIYGGHEKPEIYLGAHTPLVDNALFQHVHAIRRSRAPAIGYYRKADSSQYALGGLLVCGCCGAKLHGATRRGQRFYRDSGRSRGRFCTAKAGSYAADDVEAQVVDLIAAVELPVDWRDQIARRDDVPLDVSIEKQRSALNARLRRVQRLYELGDLDEQAFLQRRSVIIAQMQRLPDTPHRSEAADYFALVAALRNLRGLWTVADAVERRQWAGLLFKKLYVVNGQIRAAEATPLFWTLCTLQKTSESAQDSTCCEMRRRPDSNR